jgi:hypothetical protein
MVGTSSRIWVEDDLVDPGDGSIPHGTDLQMLSNGSHLCLPCPQFRSQALDRRLCRKANTRPVFPKSTERHLWPCLAPLHASSCDRRHFCRPLKRAPLRTTSTWRLGLWPSVLDMPEMHVSQEPQTHSDEVMAPLPRGSRARARRSTRRCCKKAPRQRHNSSRHGNRRFSKLSESGTRRGRTIQPIGRKEERIVADNTVLSWALHQNAMWSAASTCQARRGRNVWSTSILCTGPKGRISWGHSSRSWRGNISGDLVSFR